MRTVILVGFRGVGKSSVGRELARILGWDFYDSDAELAEELRENLADFAARSGEQAFREREQAVITRLLKSDSGRGAVFALGGGCLESDRGFHAVATFLRERPEDAIAVWIQAPLPEILERLTKFNAESRVASVTDPEELARLYEKREPRYRELAAFALQNSGWSAKITAKKLAEIARLGYGVEPRPVLN